MNRRISGAASASAVVAEAPAAAGPHLLDQAGTAEAAGSQGGVGQALLRLVHQLVGGGDLQHKTKVFLFKEGVGMQF